MKSNRKRNIARKTKSNKSQNPPPSNDSVRDSPPGAGSRKPCEPQRAPCLQSQKTEEAVRSVRLEIADGATESCCDGKSEPASDAPNPAIRKAPGRRPKAPTTRRKPGAGSRKPGERQRAPLLQPQKTEETVRSVRSENANGAAESCCHGQSESASVARGNAPSDLQAPKAAAQASAANSTPEAGIGFVPQNPPSPNGGIRD